MGESLLVHLAWLSLHVILEGVSGLARWSAGPLNVWWVVSGLTQALSLKLARWWSGFMTGEPLLCSLAVNVPGLLGYLFSGVSDLEGVRVTGVLHYCCFFWGPG